jgi:GTPase SAR1 family protein
MDSPLSVDAKIVLLVSANVGKTCIVGVAVSAVFLAVMSPTVSVSSTSKEIEIGGTVVNLPIWDTADQE